MPGFLPDRAVHFYSEVGLHAGTARRVLRAHVLALQDHHAAPGTPPA